MKMTTMADASVFSALNHTGAEFLIADLETAMVFLDVAETSRNETTVRRNRGHARHAYDVIVRLLSTLKVSDAERAAITEKIGILKKRLEATGETFRDQSGAA